MLFVGIFGNIAYIRNRMLASSFIKAIKNNPYIMQSIHASTRIKKKWKTIA